MGFDFCSKSFRKSHTTTVRSLDSVGIDIVSINHSVPSCTVSNKKICNGCTSNWCPKAVSASQASRTGPEFCLVSSYFDDSNKFILLVSKIGGGWGRAICMMQTWSWRWWQKPPLGKGFARLLRVNLATSREDYDTERRTNIFDTVLEITWYRHRGLLGTENQSCVNRFDQEKSLRLLTAFVSQLQKNKKRRGYVVLQATVSVDGLMQYYGMLGCFLKN